MDPNSEPKIQLTALLEPAGFRLVYALPLLLFSIVINFGGTFLTLDRTRVFPRNESKEYSYSYTSDENEVTYTGKKKRGSNGRGVGRWVGWSYRLDGGVGGLLAGYVLGLHAATFLALYIPNTGSSSPLSPATFLVVWIFAVIPSTLFGGRWRLAALSCIGIISGLCLSLGLHIIMHPNLRTRKILTCVLVPLATAIALVPNLPFLRLRHLAHCATRLLTSVAGAFSITFAIAILAGEKGSPGWANVYDRLWVANGSGWGKSAERGFAVLFCVLWVLGAGSDWLLRRKLGDSVDEIWEAYLAEYATGLPNERNRAGYYRPHESWWQKFLVFLRVRNRDSSARPRDIIFPSDAELNFPGALSDDVNGKYAALPMIERQYRDSTFEISPFVSPPPKQTVGFFQMVKGLPRAYTGRGAKDGGNDGLEVVRLPQRRAALRRSPISYDIERQDTTTSRKRRAPVQFQPNNSYSDSESESELDALKTPETPLQRPRLKVTNFVNESGTNLSGTTVHADESEGIRMTPPGSGEAGNYTEMEQTGIHGICDAFGLGPPPPIRDCDATPLDYSDVELTEADVTTALRQERAPGPYTSVRRQNSKRYGGVDGRALVTPRRPQGAVPMTPSLVNALKRIAVAQQEAFGPRSNSPLQEQIPGLPITATQPRVHSPVDNPMRPFSPVIVGVDQPGSSGDTVPRVEIDLNDEGGWTRWDDFWREVHEKAVVSNIRRGDMVNEGGRIGSPTHVGA